MTDLPRIAQEHRAALVVALDVGALRQQAAHPLAERRVVHGNRDPQPELELDVDVGAQRAGAPRVQLERLVATLTKVPGHDGRDMLGRLRKRDARHVVRRKGRPAPTSTGASDGVPDLGLPVLTHRGCRMIY